MTAPSFAAEEDPIVEEEESLLRQGLNTSADYAGLQTEGTVQSAVGKVVKVVLQFISFIFLIIVLFAGIIWMTAGGKPEVLKRSKSLLIHASIGLAVALMAYQVAAYAIRMIEIR